MTGDELTYDLGSQVLTAKQARARHRAGQWYTVLVGDPEAPRVELTIHEGGRWIRLAVFDPADKHNEVMSGTLLSLADPPRLLLDGLTDLRGDRPVSYSLPLNALAVRTIAAAGSQHHASSWEPVLLDGDHSEFGDRQGLIDLAERLPALLGRLEGLAWTDLTADVDARMCSVVTGRRLDERVGLLKRSYRESAPISADEVATVLKDTGRNWRVEKTEKARVLAVDVPGGRIEAMILTKYPAAPAATKFQPGHAILLTANFGGVGGTWTDTDPRPDPGPGPYRSWLPPLSPPDKQTFAELTAILLDGLDALVRNFTERPFELPA
ncbi:MAG: hypothetical protein DLM58_20315 [Pseudonocardiales bacterium]|nr:MAG: hypothetical protein DLM58_20315 [Pseudonocardiales bacterium]